MKKDSEIRIWENLIISKIYRIREVKVMLDSDLADLHGVATGNLNISQWVINRETERPRVKGI